MIAHLKQLFNDSIVYGLSGVISSLISIFLIPLYTRVFVPADYGVISILTTTSALLNIVLIFSMDNSAAVFFWDKPDEHERKKTFNSWLSFLLLTGLLGAGVITLLSKPLSILFFDTDAHTRLFQLIGFNLLLVGFQKIFNIWCRMLKQPTRAVIFSIILLLVTVGFNILFILYLKIGVVGIFYSQVIASTVGLLLFVLNFKFWINLSFISRERIIEMIRLSSPLVPAAILYWLMNASSVYFLKIAGKGNEEIGLYQVGASVANVLNIVTWAFFQSWSPFALSVSKQENAKNIYCLVFELYCVSGFFIAFSLMLVGSDILSIFTQPSYLAASSILGLLAINVIIVGIPNIMSIATNLSKQNMPYAIAIALGCCITVILFLILIPIFGKEGCAIAMILGNLTTIFYLGFRVQKIYFIPYKFQRISFIVALQLCIFLTLIQYTDSILNKAFMIGLVGISLIGYYLSRYSLVLKDIIKKD